MATHSIGTGGDFSTPQLWFDDIPEPLVEQRIGQLKNQEFVVSGSGNVLVITTRTTTSSFNIILETAPGASWKDNVNVRTNPLRYDASKGAAMRADFNGVGVGSVVQLNGTVNHLTFRSIQMEQTSDALNSIDVFKSITGFVSSNLVIQDCIVEQVGSDNNDILFLLGQSKVRNCIIIHRGNNPDSAIKLSDFVSGISTEVTGCTVVRPSNLSAAGIGLHNKYAANTFIAHNNVSMGFLSDGVALNSASDYNATNYSDGASGFNDPVPDHNVYSVPYTTVTFVQPSDASGAHDFRILAGCLLENAGIFNGTESPNDATGLPRNNPPDIGAWELSAGSPPLRGAVFQYNGIDLTMTGSDVPLSASILWTWDAIITAAQTTTLKGPNGVIMGTLAAGRPFHIPGAGHRERGDDPQVDLSQYSVNAGAGTVKVAYSIRRLP